MAPLIIGDRLVPMPEPVKIDAEGRLITGAPPDDDRPALGWVRHSWKARHGAKQPCAKCGRGVREGVQHYRHRGPGHPILCNRCYDGIMADPGPGGWAGEGYN